MGINTDKPTVALAVHGSAQVTGSLLQPSDGRVKDNVLPVSVLPIMEVLVFKGYIYIWTIIMLYM